MLNKLKRIQAEKPNEGFTIIEVMIVLAIAGLIILIVLLAVPALQRNSRNAAMKSDVAAILAGASEYATNNDGKTPDAVGSPTTTTGTYTLDNSATPGAKSDVKVQASDVLTPTNGVSTVTGVAGTIFVEYGVSCVGGTAAGTLTAPTYQTTTVSKRSVAIIYTTEIAKGLQIKCTDG